MAGAVDGLPLIVSNKGFFRYHLPTAVTAMQFGPGRQSDWGSLGGFSTFVGKRPEGCQLQGSRLPIWTGLDAPCPGAARWI